jgi:uncharacterized protein
MVATAEKLHVPLPVQAALAELHVRFGAQAHIWLFGSRAEGRAREGSDWDVALDTDAALEWNSFAVAKQACEDAAWPYRLDLVDLSRAPAEFRGLVRATGVEVGGA